MDREQLLCLNKWVGYDDETDLKRFEVAVLTAVSRTLPGAVRSCMQNAQVPEFIYGGLLGPPEVAQEIISSVAKELNMSASEHTAQKECDEEKQLQQQQQNQNQQQQQHTCVSFPVKDEKHDVVSTEKAEAPTKLSVSLSEVTTDKPSLMAEPGKVHDSDAAVLQVSNDAGLYMLLFFAVLSHLSLRWAPESVWLQFVAGFGMVLALVWILGSVPERLLSGHPGFALKAAMVSLLVGLEVVVPVFHDLDRGRDLFAIFGGLVALGLVFLSYMEPVLPRLVTQTIALELILVRAYLPCLFPSPEANGTGGRCTLPALVMLSLALGLTFSGLLRALARYTGHKRAGFTWRTKDGLPLSKLKHKG